MDKTRLTEIKYNLSNIVTSRRLTGKGKVGSTCPKFFCMTLASF